MAGSFSAALSGLNANSIALSVIGNNLANTNTVGFKASTVTFHDLVSQTLKLGGGGGNPVQIGLGVITGTISPVFSQGSIESTREPTNVAIQGDGFFMVAKQDGSAYTRAGDFSFDADGRLVSSDGDAVQGWNQLDPLTGDILTAAQPGEIIIPPGVLRDPTATTSFQALSNLDADAVPTDTFTTTIQIIDSLGAPHLATITYTNTAPGAWNYDITVPGAEITGGVVGTPFNVATGTVGFDPLGVLNVVDGGAPADVAIVTPTWVNGAAASTWSWDLVDTNGDAYLSGFATDSTTSSIAQNGTRAAQLQTISIDKQGNIVATFGSGQSVKLAQLAMASFNNPKGLFKLGANLYGESGAAGLPNIGTAGSGGKGTLIGSALETSNVDIAEEFTKMILAQRGFQASARTITVSDELLLETLNLKR